jgi:hypothetical protein
VTDLDHLASYNFANHRRVPSEAVGVKVICQMAPGRGPWTMRFPRFTNDHWILSDECASERSD